MSGSFLDRVGPVLAATGERFASLAESAPAPALEIPSLPGWTLKDTVAHVVTVAPRYSEGPEGRGEWVETPPDLPALNQAQIHSLGDLDMKELADRLRADLERLLDQIGGYGENLPSYRFHGGGEVRADGQLGILLGELVVHGWDIATALGRTWPIEAGQVQLIVEGVVPILPGWINPERVRGLSATFEVRIRTQGAHVLSFVDGNLEVNPADPRPVDVHISAVGAALLLVLYGRESQWKHIMRGDLMAWGRRPWLAFTMANLFHKP